MKNREFGWVLAAAIGVVLVILPTILVPDQMVRTWGNFFSVIGVFMIGIATGITMCLDK